MAVLTDYTTNDEVRALLGVSEDEIEDVTMALPLWAKRLETSLRRSNAAIIPLYQSTKEKPEDDRTADEQAFLDAVQIYAAHFTANTLLTSLPLSSFRRLTDGRAVIERVADPFAGMREQSEADMFSALLELRLSAELLGVVYPPYTLVLSTAAVGLTIDPVTGTTPVVEG